MSGEILMQLPTQVASPKFVSPNHFKVLSPFMITAEKYLLIYFSIYVGYIPHFLQCNVKLRHTPVLLAYQRNEVANQITFFLF